MGTGNDAMDMVNKLLDYIEINHKERISLEDVSRHVNLSKFHVNRLFKALTNKPLMDYVRNRKLSCSIQELLHTDLKIIDIAYEYGFTYEQSYIRSFNKVFGMSPDKVRKQKPSLEVTARISTKMLHQIGQNSLIVEPKFVIKPEFTIVGVEHIIDIGQNLKDFTTTAMAKDFFYNRKHQIKNILNPSTYIGLIRFSNPEETSRPYLTAVEVKSPGEAPQGMVSYKIPTRGYLRYRYIGFHHPDEITIAHLEEIYAYIFNPESQLLTEYRFQDPYYFESVNLNIAKEDYCELDIYIPIKKI